MMISRHNAKIIRVLLVDCETSYMCNIYLNDLWTLETDLGFERQSSVQDAI